MLDFRKGLLALAVAGLGIVGTASAQVQCTTAQNAKVTTTSPGTGTVTSVTPGTAATGVRSQGMTEQLQGFVISGCSGTINTASIILQVTSNAPFTNVLLSGTTNNSTDAQAQASGFGASPANVQGQLINPTTMQFSFTIPAAAQNTSPAGGAYIVVSNLRSNASILTVGSTVTLTAVGVNGIITTGNGATAVASAVTQNAIGSVSFRGFGNVAVCTTSSGSINAIGVVAITEGFITGFTSSVDEANNEQIASSTGSGCGVTGGCTNPAFGNTVGTSLALTFNGLPSGVTYYLPAQVQYTAAGNTTALNMFLVSSPTSLAQLAGGSAGSTSTGSNTGTTSVANVVAFTPTNGSFTAYYQITSDDLTHIDSTAALTNANNPATASSGLPPQTGTTTYSEITLFEGVPTTTAAVPTNGAVTVSVVLAGSSTSYPQFSSTQTATTATASSSSSVTSSGAGILIGCNTTLLFPYVANVAGYDTGLAVANASTGTSTPGNTITAQNGTCTFTFYGGGTTANAPMPSLLGTLSVPTGTTQSFLLSNAQPGFVGYAVATCTFQGGHGFAFITDGFGGGGRGLSIGYLGIILNEVTNGGAQAPASPFSFDSSR
jgi:hypothetical protein